MLSMIVAIANNNVIGKENKLLWNIPEDLKRFKEITTGKTIIMGRNTFESLGKILPDREHVVLCSSGELEVDSSDVKIVKGTYELEEYINSSKECFVIGGGIVYRILMKYANKLYITKINEDFEGDTYFPEINENEWEIIDRQVGIKNDENPYDYEYITYARINK